VKNSGIVEYSVENADKNQCFRPIAIQIPFKLAVLEEHRLARTSSKYLNGFFRVKTA
jgi:hypothetical protein